MKREVRHFPVLLDEVITALQPKPADTIVDCTVGLGGHSAELLKRISPGGKLVGMDFDAANLEPARQKLGAGNVSLHQGNFAGLPKVLAQEGVEKVDGLLADLGVASPQIDDPARGFSYREDGPLDMRMDKSRGQTAADLVNSMCERDLADAFLQLGDETEAPEIARLIIERRKQKPIETTHELMSLICDARNFTLKRAAGAKLHPAARTFQALRMLVNREIPNLQRLLAIIPQIVRPGRRAAIISFHSGEDRLVKKSFKDGLELGHYSHISPDPIIATEAEERRNPRSRSAKLRWAQVA
jgi:16S rRNA (cytosine1402-N4)-methyltransferase